MFAVTDCLGGQHVTSNTGGSDPSAILQLVPSIYEAAAEPDRWPTILDELCVLFDATAGVLGDYDFAARRGHKNCSVGIAPQFGEPYSTKFAAANPWANEAALSAPDAVCTGSQLIPDDQLRATSFYRDWLKPQGLFHSLRAVLHHEDRKIWFVGLIRRESQPDFNADELARLKTLLPHFRRAYQIDRAISERITVAESTIAAFDQIPLGIAMVAADGQVLAANRFAKQLTTERDGLAFNANGLKARRAADKARLLDLIGRLETFRSGDEASDDTDPTESMTVSRQHSLRALSVRVSMASQPASVFGVQLRAATVLISDPERRIKPDPASLTELFKLTPTEARVTAGLASGAALIEVADELGIAYETARTHLKRTFSKTDTSRQADLIRLVHSSLTPIDSTPPSDG